MPLTDNTAVAYRLRFFMMVQEWFPFDISYRHEGNVLLYFGGVLSLGNTRCQSKTLSSPDFESTYTNKASLEAFAVC